MNNVSSEQIYALARVVERQIEDISADLDKTLVVAREMTIELAAMRAEGARAMEGLRRT